MTSLTAEGVDLVEQGQQQGHGDIRHRYRAAKIMDQADAGDVDFLDWNTQSGSVPLRAVPQPRSTHDTSSTSGRDREEFN
jgi:hypothetical protein